MGGLNEELQTETLQTQQFNRYNMGMGFIANQQNEQFGRMEGPTDQIAAF